MPVPRLSDIVGAVALLVAATACSSSPAPVNSASPSGTTEQPSEIDADAAYLRRCGGCHGAKGSEQVERSLAGLDQLSRDEVERTVRFGNELMPPFGEPVDEAEIQAIVDYVMAEL